MKPVVPGTRHRWTTVPPASDTASAIGNPGVDVVSTPALIGYLETACHGLIEPHFEDGEASVGTAVDIRHRAAAFPGTEVNCEAQLDTIEGRRITFSVTAHQGGKLIMDGKHERAVVRLDSFLKSGRPKTPASPVKLPRELVFWFDIHSPWAYLAARRMNALAERHKAGLTWKPFQLPPVDRTDRRPPAA